MHILHILQLFCFQYIIRLTTNKYFISSFVQIIFKFLLYILFIHNISLFTMIRSHSDHDILKFNSNSKEFTLGWDVPDNGSKIFSRKNAQINAKDFNVTNRGSKFLEKKVYEPIAKIGSTEVPAITPTIPRKITRNQKQRSTMYIVGDAPKVETLEKKPEKTEKELEELRIKFENLKTSDKKKKKQQITQLQNQQIQKLAKKVKARQPFRF